MKRRTYLHIYNGCHHIFGLNRILIDSITMSRRSGLRSTFCMFKRFTGSTGLSGRKNGGTRTRS